MCLPKAKTVARSRHTFRIKSSNRRSYLGSQLISLIIIIMVARRRRQSNKQREIFQFICLSRKRDELLASLLCTQNRLYRRDRRRDQFTSSSYYISTWVPSDDSSISLPLDKSLPAAAHGRVVKFRRIVVFNKLRSHILLSTFIIIIIIYGRE